MNRYLIKGYELKINNETFLIVEPIGEGANSVVYSAIKKNDNSKHIIKEYNPNNIVLNRDDNGKFILDELTEKQLEKFNSGLQHFCEGGNKQIDIRNNESAMNYITNVNQIYKDVNGTAYIDMTAFNGESYDKCEMEDTLEQLLKHIKAIAVAVKSYHENGYLHLDVKPANIFILKDVSDLVFLFDFDSVIKKDELGKASMMPYSTGWAAPEQVNFNKWDRIGEWTDVYSIGEILFYKLFGRHSSYMERRPFSKYDFKETELLKNVDPKVKKLLTELFRHTLTTSEKKRYRNCRELLSVINETIEISSPTRKYLLSSNYAVNKSFFGREDELDEIENKLKENNILVITGLGGMGKTELAKQYGCKYKEKFDQVLYIDGGRSWFDIVNGSIASYISNYKMEQSSDSKEQYENTVDTLRDVISDNTLLILDNVEKDMFEDENYETGKQLWSLPCKIIFTTRNKIEDFDTLELDSVQEEALVSMFKYLSGLTDGEPEIRKIIEFTSCHTLMVELIARQIKNQGISAKEKYNELVEAGLLRVQGDVVYKKDGRSRKARIFEHIKSLYDFEKFDENKKKILFAAAMIPYGGFNRKMFNILVGDKYGDNSSDLIDLGLMKLNGKLVTMHPLIGEVVVDSIYDDDIVANFLQQLDVLVQQSEDLDNNYQLKGLVKRVFAVLRERECRQKSYCEFLFRDYNVLDILNAEESLELAKECENIFGEEMSKEHKEQLLYNMATLYAILDDCDNAKRINSILRKESITDEKIQILSDMLEAEILRLSYEFDDAIRVYLSVLGNKKYSWDRYYEEKGNILYDLMACYYKNGDIDESVKCLEECLRHREKYYEPNDMKIMDLKDYRGRLYLENKRNDLAENCFWEVIRKSTEGGLNITFTYVQLIFLYLKEKRNFDKVKELLDKTYEIRARYYPEYHDNIARVYLEYGRYYGYTENWKLSDEYFDKAYKIYKIKHGTESELVSGVLYYQGEVFLDKGKCFEAIEVLKKSVEIIETLYGDKENNQTYNAKTYQKIGDAYRGLDDTKQALMYYEKAKSIYIRAEANDDIKEVEEAIQSVQYV